MSECAITDMQDLLPELAADRLQGAERARVVDHVATCAACAADVELLRLAHRVTTRGVPSIDVARIVAALPKPPAQSESRPTLAASGPGASTERTSNLRVDRVQGGVIPTPAHRRAAPTWTSGWRIAAVAMVAVGGLSVAVLHEMHSTTAPQSTPGTVSSRHSGTGRGGRTGPDIRGPGHAGAIKSRRVGDTCDGCGRRPRVDSES